MTPEHADVHFGLGCVMVCCTILLAFLQMMVLARLVLYP